MLKPIYSKRFDRDIKRMKKRGNATDKLKLSVLLIRQEKLNERYKNHPLNGNYKGCYDCHIKPNWILIYRIEGETIQFVRTGSHADLFK
ncbi:ribosome-dependent mRNA interferase toxin YafQ [Candidatus Magnetomoraceae bacterium gMMP-15]